MGVTITLDTITITSIEYILAYDGSYSVDSLRINFSYTDTRFPTAFPPNGGYFIKDEMSITIRGTVFTIGMDPAQNTTGLDDTINASSGIGFIDIVKPDLTDTSVSATARRTAIFNNFIQGGNITVSLTYSNAAESEASVSSASVTYYNVIGIDANNILLRDHLKIFTLVDLSTDNKSVILPHTTVCKGIILHFKITAVDAGGLNTFTISPYMDQYPNGPPYTSFSTTVPEYTGSIDNTNGPIYFNTLNLVVSVISDGWNWIVLNKYAAPITIGSTGLFPGDITSETSEKNVVRYTYQSGRNYNNISLYPMTSTYLKYIFLKNPDTNPIDFTLYFPVGAGLDNQNGVLGNYSTITLRIPPGKVGAFIITFLNSRYYIISAQVIRDYSQASGFDNPTITLTKTVNFIDTASRVYMPIVTTSNSSLCKLVIIKVRTVSNIIAVAQASGVFIMDDNYTAISMASTSVLWFIINVRNGTEAYLPVCYYVPS
jgi:hypothetical protein